MTRRTFDGRDDLMEMAVPVVGRRSGVVLLQGEGLPDLVGVGAHDLPASTWLEIENRSRRGPLYDRVRHVRQGVMQLAGTTTKAAYLTGGHTYGRGRAASGASEDPGEIIVADPFGNERQVCPAPGPAGGMEAIAFDYVVDHRQMPQVIPPSDGSAPGDASIPWSPEPWLMRHRIYVANAADQTIYAGYLTET